MEIVQFSQKDFIGGLILLFFSHYVWVQHYTAIVINIDDIMLAVLS